MFLLILKAFSSSFQTTCFESKYSGELVTGPRAWEGPSRRGSQVLHTCHGEGCMGKTCERSGTHPVTFVHSSPRPATTLQAGFLEISFPSICPGCPPESKCWLTKRQISKSWLTPPVLLFLCTQDCADHKEGIRGFLRLRQDLSFFLQTWPRLPKFLFLYCVKDLLRRGPQLRRGVMTCPQGL